MKGLSGVRLHIGKRVSGIGGCMLLLCIGMVNLIWFTILGTLWLMYGVIWLTYKFFYLCFYLPIKAIIKAVKKRQRAKRDDEVV